MQAMHDCAPGLIETPDGGHRIAHTVRTAHARVRCSALASGFCGEDGFLPAKTRNRLSLLKRRLCTLHCGLCCCTRGS